MPDYTLFNLAIQAENLRNSQKAYFTLIAKARKSKLPEDFEAANKVLVISKQIEKSFDETLAEILQPGKEVQP